MAYKNRILKLKNVEVFPHFPDISDMREKSHHVPDIKVFCGNIRGTYSWIQNTKMCYPLLFFSNEQKIPLSFGEAGFFIALHHLFSFFWLKDERRS
jgi:hypothetical protein